jgi:hypothetical protein
MCHESEIQTCIMVFMKILTEYIYLTHINNVHQDEGDSAMIFDNQKETVNNVVVKFVQSKE